MQLSLCMAVPPYNYLRAGKLIAGLAVSNVVGTEFSRKYAPDKLKFVLTTTANGIHSPMFNRFMVQTGGLYRRIGETSGYSALAFRKPTLRAAMKLVLARNSSFPDNRTIRMLKQALRICNIPREPIVRLGVRKAVYLAVPSGFRQAATKKSMLQWPKDAEVVHYWKERVLPKAIVRPDIMSKLKRFRVRKIVPNSLGRKGHQ